MVYSVNVLLVATAFSELAQFIQCFLQMTGVRSTKFYFHIFIEIMFAFLLHLLIENFINQKATVSNETIGSDD